MSIGNCTHGVPVELNCSACEEPAYPQAVADIAPKVDDILIERGGRYGPFVDHADITQGIKRAMRNSRNWGVLNNDMREALEMVAHKIGRILNGDPTYTDNVIDIIGYMTLVLDRMEGRSEHGV